jgi:hypothetical protein
MQRNEHRLDRQAILRAKRKLLKTVNPRRQRSLKYEPGQRMRNRLSQSATDLKITSPDRGIMDSLSDDRRQNPPN